MAGYFLLLSWDGIAPACRALIAPIEMATGKQADFCEKPNPLMMRQNPRLSPERRAGRQGETSPPSPAQRRNTLSGPAAPAAAKKQRVKNLCHRIMDGRRLKGAEKQIVPEPLDLHILMGNHTEAQQHIAANRQLHEMPGIAFSGGKERRPQRKAASNIAENRLCSASRSVTAATSNSRNSSAGGI